MKKLALLISILCSTNAWALRTVLFNPIKAQSMAASVTSSSVLVDQVFAYACQAVWTGTPVGDIKLQASNDNATWSDVTGSDQAVSGAGSFIWNVSDVAYHNYRLVYTRSSSTGTLTATCENKGD